MKKILFATMACLMFAPLVSMAQPLATYKVSNPLVTASGSYSQPEQYAPVSAGFNTQIWPWYTHKDTVTNTGVDTFRFKMTAPSESLYTWCHVTGISGTNTSCTAKLFASADSGLGVDFVQVYSVTVTATNPVGYYSFTSWNYTNYFWAFTGVGTQVSSWYSGVMRK